MNAAGRVLGGAPFDAANVAEAETEVRATFVVEPGDRVVRATREHLAQYERQETEDYRSHAPREVDG